MVKTRTERRASKTGYGDKIIDALTAHGPMTCAQLMEAIGSTIHASGYAITALREDGQIHVSGWAHGRGRIYCAGPGTDAKRPAKKPRRSAAVHHEVLQARRVARMMSMLPVSPRTEWRDCA